jgi:beta-glucanase (GH16 family)
LIDSAVVEIGERMIPFEPMYMIFNLGMSRDFGEVDIENLPFPSYMMIDYLRVYQRPDQVNVGCNPPDYPTAQWIACNKKDFMTNPDDEILFETCESESVKSNPSLTAAVIIIIVICLLFS